MARFIDDIFPLCSCTHQERGDDELITHRIERAAAKSDSAIAAVSNLIKYFPDLKKRFFLQMDDRNTVKGTYLAELF